MPLPPPPPLFVVVVGCNWADDGDAVACRILLGGCCCTDVGVVDVECGGGVAPPRETTAAAGSGGGGWRDDPAGVGAAEVVAVDPLLCRVAPPCEGDEEAFSAEATVVEALARSPPTPCCCWL